MYLSRKRLQMTFVTLYPRIKRVKKTGGWMEINRWVIKTQLFEHNWISFP